MPECIGRARPGRQHALPSDLKPGCEHQFCYHAPSATVLAWGSHRPSTSHAWSRPCNPPIARDVERGEVLWFRPPLAAWVSKSTTSAVSDSILRPTLRCRGTTLSRAGGSCSAGFQLRGPSPVAGFPLVGFGAEVASGSSDSTMAISSPDSKSEARDGRR
jgi:hypothetical protein